VFVIDNNGFAYSTPNALEFTSGHLADRAEGYGFEGVVVDGTDVLAVHREARRAIEKARAGGGPTLLEIVTLRMEGHAVHDDAFYVPKGLHEAWSKRDPIERYRRFLTEHVADFSEERDEDIRLAVKQQLNEAVRRAEDSPLPDPTTVLEGVYADPRSSTRRITSRGDGGTVAVRTYLQAISDGLREEMRRDERVFVIGEDVGVYGGAFKVTQGFQAEFGPWRVLDSPLAETAIVGACTGASMMGMRPVAEMQFADFVSCAWDHLVTVAAKQHYRAGSPLPFVVRLPSGGGFSGGPFHSQNPSRRSRTSPGSRSSARRRRRTPRACSWRRSATRTRCCTSSTSTCTGGSRARCRSTSTRPRSARPGPTARAPTSRS
jgi:2-oxoisovalerate dehydrogenase E1 component